MKTLFTRSARRRNQKGAALVTTLAVLTILAALLVSYLVTVQLDRQSTANYSQAMRADELGLGALQEIVGGLRQEIDAGSKRYQIDGVSIYIPTNSVTIRPARLGFDASQFGKDVDALGEKLPPSLLQVSRNNAVYPAGIYDSSKTPASLASAVSTSTPSANGRSVSALRWNKPLFMGDISAAAGNQPSKPFSNKLPDWIYVTRAGSRICTSGEVAAGQLLADSAGTNKNAVLGRYAYVIYDEGSLLDINVAGAPSSVKTKDPASLTVKSYVSSAELTLIPGFSTKVIDDLAEWRNHGGSKLYPKWADLMTNSGRTGFLQYWSGDNPFLGRQDMIAYLNQRDASQAIPYLTTFSRAKNAPSASPATPSGSAIDYAAQAEKIGVANRDLANVRAPATISVKHYDDQGKLTTYPIAIGKPLLQRRFSLAKLAWLTPTGNATGISNDAIKDCFGLKWDSGEKRWNYTETANEMPSPNAIKTLDVVAGEGREPNFFELLKACILSGSLGRDPGPKDSASPDASLAGNGVMGFGFQTTSKVEDAQIFRIGASIIDQADTDSYPTVIYCQIFNGLNPVNVVNAFVGVENLPYLHRLHQIVMATTPGSYTQNIQGKIGAWLQPELWNPHQIPSNVSSDRPTKFRVRAYGLAQTSWFQWIHPPENPNGSKLIGSYSPQGFVDFEGAEESNGLIYFRDAGGSGSAYYNNPVSLTTALVDGETQQQCLFIPEKYPHITDKSNPFAAIFSGESSDPFTPKTETVDGYQCFARTRPNPEFSVVLEFLDPNGKWHAYSQMLRLQGIASASFSASNTDETKIVSGSPSKLFYNHADVRADRFSLSGDWPALQGSPATQFVLNRSIWQSSAGANSVKWFLPRASAFAYSTSGYFYPGDWQINSTSSRARYFDPDGITRPADGFRGSDSTGVGRQTYHGGVNDPRRPIILDRPFRSVGELGYVFRDEPFKTLDFWSDKSADGALLDAFSLTDEPPTVAGLVNLSNAPQTIIQAILQGAGKNAFNAGSAVNIDAALATKLAQEISTVLQAQPLLSRADLVTKLAGTIQGAFSSSTDSGNKTYAETPLRALATVSDTRTWNLCIDIIAQSGRMSPNARTLDQFTVEGEKRYWLHVSIDRFTGDVVDQQLEPVYE